MQVHTLGTGDPEVAVVGAIHGDEPCGARAVRTLADEPPTVERPVKLVVANERALSRDRRFVDRDLNRSFPGDPDGEAHEERLAARLTDELAGCETLCLHSTQSYDGPFALVDEVDAFVRSIAPRMTVDAVVETYLLSGGRIFDAVADALEVECGRQGSDAAAENAVRATREFLAATGALPESGTPRRSELPVFRLREAIQKRQADVYEVYVDNFEEVAAGEVIAAVDDEEVVADDAFHPVLVSPEGYDDVFGYRADRVGTITAGSE